MGGLGRRRNLLRISPSATLLAMKSLDFTTPFATMQRRTIGFAALFRGKTCGTSRTPCRLSFAALSPH
jgi:hypothetical protein